VNGIRRVRCTNELLPRLLESHFGLHDPFITSNVPEDVQVIGGHLNGDYGASTDASVLLVSSATFSPDPELPFVEFEFRRHAHPQATVKATTGMTTMKPPLEGR
jgi:hypothetical protein